MNIKILAVAAVLATAFAATAARADDHGRYGGSRGGESRGHWDHDRRGSSHESRGWDRGGRGDGGHWGHDRGAGRAWNDDYRGGYRGSYRGGDYRHYYPRYGYRPDYGYAPRYYAPSYYAPSYYAPGYWGGWFDDLGVVIQIR